MAAENVAPHGPCVDATRRYIWLAMRVVSRAAAAAALIAIPLGACSSDGGQGANPPAVTDCAQFTSCAACTPVIGCGWCYDSDGTGACAPGPNGCATPSFSWTWNPSGCRVTAEAGVAPGPTQPVPDGGDG